MHLNHVIVKLPHLHRWISESMVSVSIKISLYYEPLFYKISPHMIITTMLGFIKISIFHIKIIADKISTVKFV